jgi:RsiW-degrading membrane proteinase PrsW (M82 family)
MREDEEREECEIGAWGIIIAVIIAMVVSFALGHTFYEASDFKKSPFLDVLMMSIISPLSGVVAAIIWIFFYGELSNGKPKKRINKNVYKF